MNRTTHVVLRRDPNTRTWWWVCIEPNCNADDGIQLRIGSHKAAMKSAGEHLQRASVKGRAS